MWSSDGKGYYFNSDPEGVFNIYHQAIDSEEARQVMRKAEIVDLDQGQAEGDCGENDSIGRFG